MEKTRRTITIVRTCSNRVTDDRIVKQVFKTGTTKKKPRGRLRRTWIKEVRAAALKRDEKWGNIIKATQYRKK